MKMYGGIIVAENGGVVIFILKLLCTQGKNPQFQFIGR
jgi:hypothetical protein